MTCFFSPRLDSPSRPELYNCGFEMTIRHTTLGRTPLYERSARHRDTSTTHNTHKRQISMPSAEFDPANLASERPQTHALDRVGTWIDIVTCRKVHYKKYHHNTILKTYLLIEDPTCFCWPPSCKVQERFFPGMHKLWAPLRHCDYILYGSF